VLVRGNHETVAATNRLPAERVAENEAVFRRLNESIEAATELGATYATLLCECADARCRAVIRMRISEYERVRADDTRFLVASGHGGEQDAKTVERHPTYDVVAKTGYAAALARASGRSAGSKSSPSTPLAERDDPV
jgi:hypothetical protein